MRTLILLLIASLPLCGQILSPIIHGAKLGPDFTIIAVGDPHLNLEGNVDDWNAFTDWVAANKEAENIVAVLSKGDYSGTGSETDIANAWSNGDPAKGWITIDNLGIPWLSAIGNHDYDSDSPSGRLSTIFDAQVGHDRISAKPWYAGYYDDGAGGKATQAIRFTVENRTFLVISLELFPRIGAMEWALNTLAAYPHDYGIILTHGYLLPDGTQSIDSSTYGPNTYGIGNDLSGAEMWEYLKTRPNVMMVLNGHFIDSPRTSYLASTGDNGNIVHQMYANYEELDDRNGFVELRFSPAHGKVYVSDLDLDGAAPLITPFSFTFRTPPADTVPPVLNAIAAAPLGDTATVRWGTNETGTSALEYGTTTSYGSSVTDSAHVLAHSLTAPGLANGIYHYRVSTTDAAGNTMTSADGTFEIGSGGPVADWVFTDLTDEQIIPNLIAGGSSLRRGTSSNIESTDPPITSTGLSFDGTVLQRAVGDDRNYHSASGLTVVVVRNGASTEGVMVGKYNHDLGKRQWMMKGALWTTQSNPAVYSATQAVTIADGSGWRMDAGTWAPGEACQAWTNGFLVATASGITASVPDSDVPFAVGIDTMPSNGYTGTIARVLIYDRKLDASEMAQLYQDLQAWGATKGIVF